MDDTIDALLLDFDSDFISDEEFLHLHDNLSDVQHKQSNFPFWEYNRFNWENLDELLCKVEFGFEKQHIPRLQRALQLPETINIKHATVCSGLETLCILLKRLAFPIRYCDMVRKMYDALCVIFYILFIFLIFY